MRLSRFGLLWLIVAGFAQAAIYTYNDPYANPANPTNCSSAACDVIGDSNKFDIQRVIFNTDTPGSVTAQLDFNFNNGDASLTPFNIGGMLYASDLLFYTGAPGNRAWQYGIATRTHGSTVEGQLYRINNNSVRTAQDVYALNGTYRNNEVVWMDDRQAGNLTAIGPGFGVSRSASGPLVTVNLTLFNGPSNNADYLGFMNLLNAGQLSFQFSQATCANDIMTGTLGVGFAGQPVPEPATCLLMAASLCGLAVLRRRSTGA